jgi:hypothetical protein
MYGVGRMSDEEGVYEVSAENEGERVVVLERDLEDEESQEETFDGAEEKKTPKSRPRSLSDATLRSQELVDRDGSESVKEKKRREKKEEEAEEAAEADDESGVKRDRYVSRTQAPS